jgi:hypothetical protein
MSQQVSKRRPNQVLIVSTDNKFSVLALLGQTANHVTDGYGGWTVNNRPRKVGYTSYTGRNPFQLSLGIMVDGFETGDSIEPRMRQLTWMALPIPGDQPRTVKIYGAIPYPNTGSWVINGIDEGDATIWHESGAYRLRQDLTLTMLEYVKADSLDLVQARAQLSPSTRQPYVIKKGDTFNGIAALYLGDPTKGNALARANGINDPASIGKYIGKSIKLNVQLVQTN